MNPTIHLLWHIQQKLVNASQVQRKIQDPTPAGYLSESEDKPSIQVQKQTRCNQSHVHVFQMSVLLPFKMFRTTYSYYC